MVIPSNIRNFINGTYSMYHTPLEGWSGSEQFSRLMSFTQLFYDISGTQNRKDQNFLTRTFFLIAILRYPTFSYCFYYIATFEPSHFCEIFTKLHVISEWIYLGLWNFLRLSLTSVGICCWRNFWNQLHHFTTRGHQSVVVWAKNEAISCLAPPSGYVCDLGN